ncbi:hypothetical protein M0R45_007023 [Rubus argutus]|uniref:Uncharacterized protein n=1 Tax=Rubus argutus TaxID=59490 RepID=A0AAW1YSA0_RUBAR
MAQARSIAESSSSSSFSIRLTTSASTAAALRVTAQRGFRSENRRRRIFGAIDVVEDNGGCGSLSGGALTSLFSSSLSSILSSILVDFHLSIYILSYRSVHHFLYRLFIKRVFNEAWLVGLGSAL